MRLTPGCGEKEMKLNKRRLMKTPLLSVKNLSTHFFTRDGIVKAVNDISYDINEGEILGLVGESGCGKSVSALSLLGLIPNPPGKIVNGEIIFEGRDLMKLSNDEICKVRGHRIAIIFQEPMTSLNPVLTIGDQIKEPITLHKGLTREDALKKTLKLLNKVHISQGKTRANAYPHEFSGGMQQRVMIAMGISCSPRLIIADEPTTALDVTIQNQLLELMKQLSVDSGSALLLITHNLGIVARYADRVNVMYAGQIVEKAVTRDLYRDPRHPYTIGLMASVPRLDQDVRKKLVPIEGQPPDLIHLPPGCPFMPRCKYRIERCGTQNPKLTPVSENHETACWVDVKKN
jgi:oligopeptide transport system ATP-binding protein